MHIMYCATGNGLYRLRPSESDSRQWETDLHVLNGHALTALDARDELVVVGGRNGVACSENLGIDWHQADDGLPLPHVRALAIHPDDPKTVFAGTEPAGIFYLNGKLTHWSQCVEVMRLREEHGWSLPYSPEAGCVRDFAFRGKDGYAAVEVGGLLVTADSGRSWKLVEGSCGDPESPPDPEPFIWPDVHEVRMGGAAQDAVYCPTGDGMYHSEDGGRLWRRCRKCYCRSVLVDPDDADHWLLGSAQGVSRYGTIEETTDQGGNWADGSTGTQSPWSNTMVEKFIRQGGDLYALLTDGRLMVTSADALAWREILEDIPGIKAVAFVGTDAAIELP